MNRYLDHQGITLQLDDELTLSRLRDECPGFYSMASGRSDRKERREAYLGHVIVQYTLKHSDQTTSKNTAVYAYDVKRRDTFCISTRTQSTREVKRAIRRSLGI